MKQKFLSLVAIGLIPFLESMLSQIGDCFRIFIFDSLGGDMPRHCKFVQFDSLDGRHSKISL